MINLELKDLRKDYLYVIRVYGKEFIKVHNKNKLKGVVKCLRTIGVNANDIHVYKLTCRKVVDY